MEAPLNILLVEDNRGDVALFKELLRESDISFKLTHSSSVKETISQHSSSIFDLILLDLGLPDSNGIDTLKRIKECFVNTALIIMTGWDDGETALQALREGAQDYLIKNRMNADMVSRSIKYSIERKKIGELLHNSEDRYRQLNAGLEIKVRERTTELELLNHKLQKELSERIKIEEELRKSETQLIELNATKDKFFNIVAHDLKNPFTSLLGSTELLFQNIELLDRAGIKKLAVILNDSAKSGYAILQNLLDWSRSQTGLLKINPENLNLKAIIDENILNLELFSSNKDIDVISEVNPDTAIYADKNMVNTIVRNLISNALKFSYRSGKIRISAFPDDEFMVVSVRDNGIGIPADKIDKLFRIDTKFSMPGTENEQGTGLGLKLCKEFVEKQGGKIWVTSEENKGSDFRFTLAKT
ncbi:MAG TPA: hybrid sensor histidine kinase/response regulator [Bacteroidales bacterium]|nr:hybrid sensor histidine kinase/response regulator [Bacteroidales bacterium]